MGPRTVLFRPRQPLTLLFALAAKDGITRLIRSALHLYGGERWLHPMLGDCAHGAFYHNTSERRPALRRLAHLYKTNTDRTDALRRYARSNPDTRLAGTTSECDT